MATVAQLAAKRAEYSARPRLRVTTTVSPAIAGLPAAFKMNATDRQIVLKLVDDRFRTMMSALYESEGSTGGSRWKELSPAYMLEKGRQWGRIRAGRGGLLADIRTLPARYRSGLFRLTLGEFKILQLTRRLRLSLTSKNAEHIAISDSDDTRIGVWVGTTVPYAQSHYDGEGRLPVRNPIQRTRSQDQELGRVALDGFRAAIEQKIRRLQVVA